MIFEAAMTEQAVKTVISLLPKVLKNLRSNSAWGKVFISSGEDMADQNQCNETFDDDIAKLFSPKRMKKLSTKLKDRNGFNLDYVVHDEIFKLLVDNNVEQSIAEKMIDAFWDALLNTIKDEEPEVYKNYCIGEIRDNSNEIISILKGLKNSGNNIQADILTESKINYIIADCTCEPKLSLSFFEIDDDEFVDGFSQNITKEKLYIIGQTKEETILRLVNLIRGIDERELLVVRSEDAWNYLCNQDIKNRILIPSYRADYIKAIDGNTNIFIYNENETCNNFDKIHLRKRTHDNLINALEMAGMENEKAYDLLRETHGLYTSMKKRMYNGAGYISSVPVKLDAKIKLTVLLCGQWEENDGDKKVMETLSGMKYDDLKTKITPYMLGETPFVIDINSYRGKSLQLFSVVDAWEELGCFVDDDTWKVFVGCVKGALINNAPTTKDMAYDTYNDSGNPGCSSTLKHGMIVTLIMWGYYYNDIGKQNQVDGIVRSILDSLQNSDQWSLLSQYMQDLCEASPDSFLGRLEEEMNQPTGMMDTFGSNKGNNLFGHNYYTHILNAIEELLQQSKYAVRAVKLIWSMYSYIIEYNIANNPKEMLVRIYCPWINTTALTTEERIQTITDAAHKYSNAWDVLYADLGRKNQTVFSINNITRYRATDDIEPQTISDYNKLCQIYSELCIRYIGNDIDRWVNIIGDVGQFSKDETTDMISLLRKTVLKSNDDSKVRLKAALRTEISRNRFYCNTDWVMSEDKIALLEECMNDIIVDDKVKDYIYLFEYSVDFPLMNPTPYDNPDYMALNDKKYDSLMQEKLSAFKRAGLSLSDLIRNLDDSDMLSNRAGYLLAKYYDDSFNESTLIMLLENSNSIAINQYVNFFIGEDESIIEKALTIAKKKDARNEILAGIVSLENIKNPDCALINNETVDIKTIFWQKEILFRDCYNTEVAKWAISECQKYGNNVSYIELLYDVKNRLSMPELYDALMSLEKMEPAKNFNGMAEHLLEKILVALYEQYITDAEKSAGISKIELLYRDQLGWKNMKCTQCIMRKSPVLYAKILRVIFKQENSDDEVTQEKRDYATKLYRFYMEANFCPADVDGVVDYSELVQWVNRFDELLKAQNQHYLLGSCLGRLFAYSPIGDDNYYPCESVRKYIEDYHNNEMINNYGITEMNKRGVYAVDAGKSERELAGKYRENADTIRSEAPFTATIFDRIAREYEQEAVIGRKRAEDE